MDYKLGSDTKTCGLSINPCKTLRWAVDQITDEVTLRINGNQHLDTFQSIKVEKSLWIQGHTDAAIFNKGNGVVFEISRPFVNISFAYLRFESLSDGLIKFKPGLTPSSNINVHNCYFGKIYPARRLRDSALIKSTSNKGSVNLYISTSSFVDFKNSVLRIKTPTPVVIIKNCSFNGLSINVLI